jgi:hypothetical protein
MEPALTSGNAGSEPVPHLNPKAYSRSIRARTRIDLSQFLQHVCDVVAFGIERYAAAWSMVRMPPSTVLSTVVLMMCSFVVTRTGLSS